VTKITSEVKFVEAVSETEAISVAEGNNESWGDQEEEMEVEEVCNEPTKECKAKHGNKW